jgi:hypothetical protein
MHNASSSSMLFLESKKDDFCLNDYLLVNFY